jgi:hypothetical protein
MASSDRTTSRRLWFAVGAGFVLLVSAWTVLFVVAHRAHVGDVPLAANGGRP